MLPILCQGIFSASEIPLNVPKATRILIKLIKIATFQQLAHCLFSLDGILQRSVPTVLNSSVTSAILLIAPCVLFASPTPTPVSVELPASAIRIIFQSPIPSTPPHPAFGTISLLLFSLANSTARPSFLAVFKMTVRMRLFALSA
jgi:hypothetical protein